MSCDDREIKPVDIITAQKLRDGMRAEAAKRREFQPAVRVKRPWLGDLAWARHKKKLAEKRRRHDRMARQTRRAQRRGA